MSQGPVAFYTTYKSRDGNVARTVRKLENLLNTLETLDNALQNRQFNAEEMAQLAHVEDSIAFRRDSIAELKVELDGCGNCLDEGILAAGRRAGRKLAYSF